MENISKHVNKPLFISSSLLQTKYFIYMLSAPWDFALDLYIISSTLHTQSSNICNTISFSLQMAYSNKLSRNCGSKESFYAFMYKCKVFLYHMWILIKVDEHILALYIYIYIYIYNSLIFPGGYTEKSSRVFVFCSI